MREFLTKRFTIFQSNNELTVMGLYQFFDHIKNHLFTSGKIMVNPQQNDINIIWSVTKRQKNNNIKFSCKFWRFILSDFQNFLLLFLRRYNVLWILFYNNTGQIIYGNEVVELWGYRLILLEDTIIFQQISHQELYDSSTQTLDDKPKPPSPCTVYCGPEGKICGWEKQ